jgi:hypothetical protein
MFLMAAVLATAASASPLASLERADERVVIKCQYRPFKAKY